MSTRKFNAGDNRSVGLHPIQSGGGGGGGVERE